MIIARLMEPLEVRDAKHTGTPKQFTMLDAGEYILERIPNPSVYKAVWLVVAGTKIGMAINCWRQYIGDTLELIEDGVPMGRDREIQVTIKSPMKFKDASISGRPTVIRGPGTFDLERIDNPTGSDVPWLVFKGTLIGGAETWWRMFIKSEGDSDSDTSIVLIEERVPMISIYDEM